jgi:hypothetical protein
MPTQNLAEALKCQHRVATSYGSWANETVDIFCCAVLKALRQLTSEFQLGLSEWPRVVHIFQSILNNAPSTRLAGRAPITVFTQLLAENPVFALRPSDGIAEIESIELLRAQELIDIPQMQNAQ